MENGYEKSNIASNVNAESNTSVHFQIHKCLHAYMYTKQQLIQIIYKEKLKLVLLFQDKQLIISPALPVDLCTGLHKATGDGINLACLLYTVGTCIGSNGWWV